MDDRNIKYQKANIKNMESAFGGWHFLKRMD